MVAGSDNAATRAPRRVQQWVVGSRFVPIGDAAISAFEFCGSRFAGGMT